MRRNLAFLNSLIPNNHNALLNSLATGTGWTSTVRPYSFVPGSFTGLLAVIGFLFTLSVTAATGTQTDPAPTSLSGWQTIIPILVPILVAALRLLLPKIPVNLLPVIAPIIGSLADYALSLASGSVANPVLGAILGAAGVGLREVFDQNKPGKAAGGFMLCMLLITPGCYTLDPAGPYKGDKVLFNADQTLLTSYQVVDNFLIWEKANPACPVEAKKLANTLREDFPPAHKIAFEARNLYANIKAMKGKADPADMQGKLATLTGMASTAISNQK